MATLTVKQGIDTTFQMSKDTQILLVGKKKLLKDIRFEGDLAKKFSNLVDSKTWSSLSQAIVANGASVIPLHLNLATVCF